MSSAANTAGSAAAPQRPAPAWFDLSPAHGSLPAANAAWESPCITAHEFWLRGQGARGGTGVLLVHGLTGTPNEMRILGKGLHRAGFSVYGMQLAGHCGSSEDLLDSHWHDWSASVRAAAERLLCLVDRVVVIGLSMGAVLALDLAAEGGYASARVAGVGALSTVFHYDGWSMPLYTRLSFLLKPLRALGIARHRVFMEQPPYGIKDEALRQRVVAQMHSGDSSAAGLPGNPWYSVIEVHDLSRDVLRRLGRVRVPCLVIHAAEDDVASVANARLVQQGVQGPVDLVLLHDSYHMITIDRERREVLARTVAFVERVAAGAAP
jgi:carboxylesterase